MLLQNPYQEMDLMKNAIRSQADFTTSREMAKFYNCSVSFVTHEAKVYQPGSDTKLAGDIDSLFTCEDLKIRFLLERKRHAGPEVINQILRTRESYKENMERRGMSEYKFVSILFTEIINEEVAQLILEQGIHVIQPGMETRFAS